MKLFAALTHEQGQDFVIVSVKNNVINDPKARDEIIAFAEQQFGVRTALITERSGETFGPRDIVNWLSSIAPEQLPWREYTVS